MNLDQRNDDRPICSGELPVATGPSDDLSDLSTDEEFEETPFSKWTLPISLFVATVFTTLWAGAYQAYNGPIHGPVNFLLEHPETLWRGIPFAATLLGILVTHECGHYVLSRVHSVPASKCSYGVNSAQPAGLRTVRTKSYGGLGSSSYRFECGNFVIVRHAA